MCFVCLYCSSCYIPASPRLSKPGRGTTRNTNPRGQPVARRGLCDSVTIPCIQAVSAFPCIALTAASAVILTKCSIEKRAQCAEYQN